MSTCCCTKALFSCIEFVRSVYESLNSENVGRAFDSIHGRAESDSGGDDDDDDDDFSFYQAGMAESGEDIKTK